MPQLAPCPNSPNCVSSQAADEGHTIAPLRYQRDRREALTRLKQVVGSLPRTQLVEERDDYLRFEAMSFLFRFVDDVEFLFDDATKTIHCRSASRTGYGDFGVNRRRIETIRAQVAGTI
ncbi:MAG: DUF1499 domain-containing protein [Nitrospiraceae bacterium]